MRILADFWGPREIESCNFQNLLVFGFCESSQNFILFRQHLFSWFQRGTLWKILKPPEIFQNLPKWPLPVAKMIWSFINDIHEENKFLYFKNCSNFPWINWNQQLRNVLSPPKMNYIRVFEVWFVRSSSLRFWQSIAGLILFKHLKSLQTIYLWIIYPWDFSILCKKRVWKSILEFEDGVSKNTYLYSASVQIQPFLDYGFVNLQIFANYVLDKTLWTTDQGRTMVECVLGVLSRYPKFLAAAGWRFQPLTHCNAKQGKKVNKQGNAVMKTALCIGCSILQEKHFQDNLLVSQDCPLFYPVQCCSSFVFCMVKPSLAKMGLI